MSKSATTAAHRVPCDDRIRTDHDEAVDDGLAEQHPVEVVFVQRRQARDVRGRLLVEGKKGEVNGDDDDKLP